MNDFYVYFPIYLIIGYLNLLLSLNIPNQYDSNRVLFDIGFKFFPTISAYIPNIIMVIFWTYFFIKFFICDRKILGRYFCLLSWLFFIRLFSFSLTIPPPCFEECISKNSFDSFNIFSWNVYMGCSDNMFSGHAAHITLIMLYLIYHPQGRDKIGNKNKHHYDVFVAKLLYLPYMIMLIASRLHYSADVYIGCILSIAIFYWDRYKILYERNRLKLD